ncbi:uncharacterized protein L203_105817 [Cryptococcus depauperatus CBS 7841]|uniref:Uncharacterized protein n=1 Tax=Cryptococcus depauperatus CBS 7841 TaxID=1295531 RepID=A0AAJ8JY19_9TREE
MQLKHTSRCSSQGTRNSAPGQPLFPVTMLRNSSPAVKYGLSCGNCSSTLRSTGRITDTRPLIQDLSRQSNYLGYLQELKPGIKKPPRPESTLSLLPNKWKEVVSDTKEWLNVGMTAWNRGKP